jgi:methylthioribose-1-phosphate isomerase
MLLAIRYTRGSLELLEQRKLPLESVFVPISGPDECWAAIRDMTVRGAPAIGISAALSLAVGLEKGGGGSQFASVAEAVDYISTKADYLVTRRAPSGCGAAVQHH